MAEKQVTTMVIKVDLECEKCSKKIKKVLCEIPQIQNQIYDKKANTVTITVVCCSPERIKQKICCKGGETIKGIEIKVPGKPADTKPVTGKPEDTKPVPGKPEDTKPVPVCPPVLVYALSTCCRECYGGGHGGPCFHGYAGPHCYDPAYGRLVHYSWGGRGCNCQRSGYYVCRCEYVCEEYRSPCIIM